MGWIENSATLLPKWSLKSGNRYETVEIIEERAQRLMLLGVVKVCKGHHGMFDSDPRLKSEPFMR